MNQIVIVESPAKAKTINNYLGKNFIVLASYGHIRDLPNKDGSVKPDENFSMDWEVSDNSKGNLKAIADAAKSANEIYLATDPDREGEAISWHVLEELRNRKILKDKNVKRVTFNAITKNSVLQAMKNPRGLNMELIDAYLARRALDYLVGFKLSPVLWRKVPGSKSAGRVQSVALRLICERELEIEKFIPKEYWDITVDLENSKSKKFKARLTQLENKKLEKFSLSDENSALEAEKVINANKFCIEDIIKKEKKRKPYAPFTTSTMQQEAARRLYFSAKKTMDTAQKLYEGFEIKGETVGLITYMRTDGVQIDPSAIEEIRKCITNDFGENCLPQSPILYSSKAKNAQEAHEAIRPTDILKLPNSLKAILNKDQLQLYTLIWNRTVASQMESAILDQVSVVISSDDKQTKLRASGSMIKFEGFLRVYEDQKPEDNDKNKESNEEKILPPMTLDEDVKVNKVEPKQHFTQPPPRYSEASIVKAMEELGIGRPSTYASIIQTIQNRSYVKLENRRFIPEDRGRVVTAFLQNFFTKYVEYSFTADLENKLDEVSDGKLHWKDVLTEFWGDFINAIEDTSKLRITEVIDTLDAMLEPHLFPKDVDNPNPRNCPTCKEGQLSLKFGKFGGFIGCKNYPTCKYTRQLSNSGNSNSSLDLPKILGKDPETQLDVILKLGPYGLYIQLGEEKDLNPEQEEENKETKSHADKKETKKKKTKRKVKPKRSAVPKGTDPSTIELEKGLKILSLPREIGNHPDSGELILAGIGRFGPYLKYGDKYQSVPPDDDILDLGLNRAVTIIEEGKNKKGNRRIASSKTLGNHPKGDKPVMLKEGRYGPYIEYKKVRATIPKDIDKDTVTLDLAIKLIEEKELKQSDKKKKKNSK